MTQALELLMGALACQHVRVQEFYACSGAAGESPRLPGFKSYRFLRVRVSGCCAGSGAADGCPCTGAVLGAGP